MAHEQSPRASSVSLLTAGACGGCNRHCVPGMGMTCIVNRQGLIEWVGKIAGPLRIDDVLHRKLDDVIHPIDHGVMKKAEDRVFGEGRAVDMIVRGTKSGHWWQVTASPSTALACGFGSVVLMRGMCRLVFDLSASQRVILARLGSGRTVEYIAQRMEISENTVRTQLLRARKTIGSSSMIGLTFWSVQNRDVLARYRGSQIL